MNPSSTLRFRRTTAAIALGWAVFAIALSLGSFRAPVDQLHDPFNVSVIGDTILVESIGPGARAAASELAVGDRVLEVNGASYLLQLRQGSGWMREGVANTYLLEKRDGRRFTVELPPESLADMTSRFTVLLHGLMLLVAVIYIATGGIVWWLRRDRPGPWALLLFSSAMTVQLAHTIQAEVIAYTWECLTINMPLIGATTFHLFTTYPIEPGWIVRHRRIQLLPYAAAFGLIFLGFMEAPLGMPIGSANKASFLFTMGLIVASLTVLGRERHRHREGALKDRADVMFLGAVVSFFPVVLVLLAQWWLEQPFRYYLALLWVFLFPMAVGYGMLKKQLFGIRAAAKSSAAYGASSVAIVAMFAFLITFADTLVWRLGVSFRWFQVGFLFFAILAFDPLRRRMQNLVDRFFDRDRAGYRVAVREISEAMVSMLSLSEIADRILVALTDTMGVERAMVLLIDDDGKRLRAIAGRGDWDEDDLNHEIPSDHPICKHLWMRREDLSRADFDDEPDIENREACRDEFDTLEVEVLVPILYGVDLLGAIAVGRKLSGDRLAADDRLLLRTLANQSSVAIENAKAFDEIAKLNETLEARVEERTRELRETQLQLTQAEKMKSLGQLVAGVAHELNNPIGFVHANLQLLDEHVNKLVEGQRTGIETERVRDAIGKLLARSREGTQRVKKIVEDLRTFSRMDQAELQDADLHEEIERTLALMEPQFKNNIRVVRDFGDLPRVRCYPGQLNQVFLNLLVNACYAIGKDGEIRVKTRPTDGGVRLEFRDDGSGLPEDVQSRIFDPFFTTKAVGEGTGLGLSLSHGIIERHGGRILVSSELGHGTTFVIDLPLVATADEG